MKITYETRDGKTFTDLSQANAHEKKLDLLFEQKLFEQKLHGAFSLAVVGESGGESDASKLRRLCDKSEVLMDLVCSKFS